MPPLRTILAVWTAALLGGALVLAPARAAEPLPPLVTTTATSTTDPGGRPWGFIALGENRPGLIRGHNFAVYSKSTAGGPFSLRGVIAPTADPTAISVLLARGAALGDSLPALEAQLGALHALLLTPPGQPARTNPPAMSLAQRLAALQARAAGDTRIGGLLDLYGLSHPALRLVRGTAWAGRLDIPVGTEVVLEVRERDPSGTDLAVIGRVTVHAGLADSLPAPGPLVAVPDTTAQGDLTVRLRWATSDALRQAGPRHQGDVVWRLSKTFAEARGFDAKAPSAAVLDGLALTGGGDVLRLPGPVYPAKLFDLASVGDFALDRTNSYLADDNGRFLAGGVPFVEGAQYYYFAAAADPLGRPGDVSGGLLATAYRRLPPHMPSRLRVSLQWDRTNHQYWDVSWAPNPPDGGTPTTGYELYRGSDFAQLTAAQRGGLNLEANPIIPGNPVAIQRVAVVDDPGAAAGPALHVLVPGDGSYGTNWWFAVRAVRAVHASPPGGAKLVSSLSPPALGALRNTAAPPAPDPSSFTKPVIDCLRVACIVDQPPVAEVADAALDGSAVAYIARCRRQPGIGAAHFLVKNLDDGTTVVPETVVVFPPDEDVVELDWTLPLSKVGANLEVSCAGEVLGTHLSDWATSAHAGVVPAGNQRMAYAFLAGAIAESERKALPAGDRLFGGLTPGCSADWPANTHLVVSPGTGLILHPSFNVPLGEKARQYRVYRRIENGPMTLIAQGLHDYTGPGSSVACEDTAPPVSNGRVHYFSQFLDENGRPSTMHLLARLTFTGDAPPVPVLLTPTPTDFSGTLAAPVVTLSWVEPPEHAERFEIFFATEALPRDTTPQVSSLVAHLNQQLNPTPVVWKVHDRLGGSVRSVVPLQQSFLTGRVGGDLGPGPRFTVTMGVNPSLKYRVWMRALGPGGEPSDQSRVVEFQWQPPATPPANIAWPARPLPPVAAFNAGIQAVDFRDVPDTRLIWGYTQNGAVAIPLRSVQVDSTPVGIRVGSLAIDNDGARANFDPNPPNGPIFRTPTFSATFGKADPNKQLFTRDGDSRQLLLPCVLYRTQVANDRFPAVSGDVIQCSPLINGIAWVSFPSDGNGSAGELADPLFRWVGPDYPTTPVLDLYLVDTQPVVQGARYRYWLVRFSDLGEPIQTVPCGEVTVKSP